ncbi:MAG: hypothetical protein PHT69_09220 [Bacteroidales bacterium]|nr:hypothetical protein [Bacteroidales bacterium]
MSKENNIDDIFKNGLSHYTEDPPDGMWDAISDKQSKKAIPWWTKLPKLIILIGLGVIVCIVAVSFITSFIKQQTFKHQLELSQNTLNEKSNDSLLDLSGKINNDILNPIDNSDIVTPENNSVPSESEDKTDNTNNSTNSNNSKSYASGFSGNNVSTIIQTQLHNQSAESLSDFQEQTDKPENELIPVSEVNEESLIAMPQDEGNNASVQNYEEFTPSVLINNNVTTPELVEENTMSNTEDNTPPYVKPKARKPVLFRIGVFATPTYTTKSITETTAVDPVYHKLRDDSEMPLLSANYGFSLQLEVDRFFLNTGLSYQTLGEKLNYNFNTVDNIDTSGGYFNHYTYTIPDPNNINNTIVVFDSTWISSADTTFRNILNKRNNSYTYLNIPLNIGYYFVQSEKHRIGFSLGVSYLRILKQNAGLLNTTADEFLHAQEVESIVSRNVTAYSLSLIYCYSFNSISSFTIQPEFNQTIGSIFNEDYAVKQNYNQLGLRLGLTFKIK